MMSESKLQEVAETRVAEEAERKAAADAQSDKPKRTIHWDDELMTTRQLMEFLSLSRTKIWELVNKEQLPAFKIGGDYRYRRSEVIEWLERFRVKRG
jgi:excisionase family DNA binding protein